MDPTTTRPRLAQYTKTLELRPVHPSLPQEVVQLIAQHCVEPYGIKLEEVNKVTCINDWPIVEDFPGSEQSRYRCTPTFDPRYLTLVSASFEHGIRQGLKNAFNGHFVIPGSEFGPIDEVRIGELLARHKLDWLLPATTTLKFYNCYQPLLSITAMFQNLQACEIEEEREIFYVDHHVFPRPASEQLPAAGSVHDDSIYSFHISAASDLVALRLLEPDSYRHWHQGSPMLGHVRFLHIHRLKCKEGYVRVKVDVTASPVKILAKCTIVANKTPNLHDGSAQLPRALGPGDICKNLEKDSRHLKNANKRRNRSHLSPPFS